MCDAVASRGRSYSATNAALPGCRVVDCAKRERKPFGSLNLRDIAHAG